MADTLFRFATAGSVDDGKSTLVGRLLHDSKSILADQLEQVTRTSAERGFGNNPGAIDFALLTDGLRAEREQGITIDVAYRYFSTGRRSFILADCPGHVQYTRNMVTGATTADAVVVLIDARKGVLEQTRRHLAVVQLLRVPHVILAVNKIDLVDYSEARFVEITAEIVALAEESGLPDAHVIPVSALAGDNVVERSRNTPWYTGPSLLELLETLPSTDELDTDAKPLRLPIQLVIRPQGALADTVTEAEAEAFRDYRAVAGRISSGTIRVGDRVQVFPGGATTTVVGIDQGATALTEASAPRSVAVQLADELDAARGTLLVSAGTLPTPRRELDAALFWFGSEPLRPGARVLVKSGTSTVKGIVTLIHGRRNLTSLQLEDAETLHVNDIGQATIHLSTELAVEEYSANRGRGAFLVIDAQSGATLAAGIVTKPRHLEGESNPATTFTI